MKKFLLFIFIIPFCFNAQIFIENFESGTFPPTGWTINQVNPTETWKTLTPAAEGTYGAQVQYDANLVLQNEDLISPSIDLSSVTQATLNFLTSSSYFWGVAPNNNYDISAHISIDGGTTWTEVWNEDDLATAQGGTFVSFTVYPVTIDLANYVGNSNVKLKFNYYGTDGAQWSLDDVKILACPGLTGIALGPNGITTSSIDLDWDDTHPTYDVEYGPAGFAQGSGTIVSGLTTSAYEIPSLTEATPYDIYITGICSGGSTSEVLDILGLYTALDSATDLDYSMNFDDPAPLYAKGWRTLNNGLGNNWILAADATIAQSPDNFMAYSYNSNNAADAWAFSRGLNLTAGQPVEISFYYKVASASFPEKLKVSIGNDRTVAAQTEVLWDNNGGANLVNTDYAQAIISYTPTTTGVHYVAFNCYSDADMFRLYVDTFEVNTVLSVEDISQNGRISILYPNPAKDNITLKLADNFDANRTVVTITDMNGKQVFSTNYSESINIAQLAKGVYIATISDGINIENQKLIKE